MSLQKTREAIQATSRKEVFDQALQKAKAVQPKLNAMVTFCEYEDGHLATADQNSPFYGVPIVLKDNINTKGIKTTASSRILDNYIPVYDATIVEKLKKAGALLVGKASLDELGMGGSNRTAYTGPVHNPYDLDRISGGSSGGSAVLVASGVVPFAVGSDTGDSVRKPASYNHIVGVKPTYGRISRYGIIPYASSLDHVGYFTRNIVDAAAALTVLAGRDDHDMTSSFRAVEDYAKQLNHNLSGKRIAVLQNVTDAVKDPAILQQFEELLGKLKAAGAIVEPVRFNEHLMKALLPVYFIISNAEASANHSNLDGIRFGMQEDGSSVEEVMVHSRTKGFSSFIRQRFLIGSYALFAKNQEKVLRKAQKVRRLIVEDLKQVLANYDVVLTVAAGSGAPLIESTASEDRLSEEYLIAENHLVLGNFSGYPSMTLPLGFDSEQMPVGINITANPFAEQMMFDIGAGMEELLGNQDRIQEVEA